MKRGPKPKPSAVRRFEGNPGKRPFNPNEPHTTPQIPEAPDHLDEEGRAEWVRVSESLHAIGLLSNIDRAALSGYCTAWSRYVRAEREIQKIGGEIVEAPSGAPIQNPWLSISNRALKQIKEFAVEFGMSPSARTRVHAEPPGGDFDSLEAFKRDGGVRSRDRGPEAIKLHSGVSQ